MQSPSQSRRGALHAALVSVLLAMAVAFALLNHDDAIAGHAADGLSKDPVAIDANSVTDSSSEDP